MVLSLMHGVASSTPTPGGLAFQGARPCSIQSAIQQRTCSKLPHSTISSRRRWQGNMPARLLMSADDLDMSAFFAEVDNRQNAGRIVAGEALTGAELRQIVMDKWKYPLETRIHRRRDAFGKQTIWLQIMWKHLWEQSFPMTEEEYDAQMDAVAWYINEWGLSNFIRKEIQETTQNPGLTVNGLMRHHV